jgi:uncharacterized ferredoxin-like protein
MVKKFDEIRDAALRDVAEFMCVAARTAPKTRGVDNLEIFIVGEETTKKKLIAAMKEIGKKNNRPSCIRDADTIHDTPYIVVIATKVTPLGLNCGFCGFATCEELKKTGGVCVYNSMDLGIALGSAVGVAARFHVDNRLMYSIGKAALKVGLLGQGVTIAIGIPLSATGKNPFFDRK